MIIMQIYVLRNVYSAKFMTERFKLHNMFDMIGSRLGMNKGRAFYVFSNVCKWIKESGNFRDYVE